MSELKPCPVCKAVPQADAIPDHGWIVGCRCTMKIEFHPTEAEAVAAWNRRLRMSDQAIPYTELWRDGECSFILAREDFHRLVGDTQRLARFRTLWAQYRATLSQPFGKTREDDGRITASVDAAFQALDQLSKEGV